MSKYELNLKDQNGQIQNYEIIMLFKDEHTQKQYIVYTDGTYSGVHEKRLFAAKYILVDQDSIILIPIEDAQELQMIEDRLTDNS